MAKTQVSLEDKLWAAVGYIWILSLVSLAARKENNFVKEHAGQGLLLFVISLVMMIIPILGWIINVIIVICCIVGIVKSLQGEKWKLPLLGGAAESFSDWVIKTIKL